MLVIIFYSCDDGESDSSSGDYNISIYDNTYTVTFLSYKGATGYSDQNIKYLTKNKTLGESLTIAPLTKTGYKINGYTNESGDVIGSDYKIEKNQTLIANWQPITYKIIFDKNGGAGSGIAEISATYDVEVTLPNNTYNAPEGYKATDGWCNKKDSTGYGVKFYSDGEKIKNLVFIDNNTVTLYANYSLTDSVVKFLGLNDELLKTVQCDSGNKLNSLDIPDTPVVYYSSQDYKEGYVVRAWYCNNEIIDINSYIINGSVTFKAKYEPITYTIKFDKNGCTGELPPDIECVYGMEYTIPKNNLTASSGEIIAGWSDSIYSSGKKYNEGDVVKNLAKTDKQVITLYSNTTLDTDTICTITLKTDHGTLTDAQKTFTVKCNDTVYQYDRSSSIYKSLPDLRTPAVSGYKFSGWAIENSESAFNYSTTIKKDTTFNAVWTPYEANICFNVNCPYGYEYGYDGYMGYQKVSYGVSVPLNKNTYKIYKRTNNGDIHYKFLGWTQKRSDIASDDTVWEDGDNIRYSGDNVYNNGGTINLYAHWEANPVNINISIDAATNYNDIECTYNASTKIINAYLKGFTGSFNMYLDGATSATKTFPAANGSAQIDPFNISGLSIGIHTICITAIKDGITYSKSFVAQVKEAQ